MNTKMNTKMNEEPYRKRNVETVRLCMIPFAIIVQVCIVRELDTNGPVNTHLRSDVYTNKHI